MNLIWFVYELKHKHSTIAMLGFNYFKLCSCISIVFLNEMSLDFSYYFCVSANEFGLYEMSLDFSYYFVFRLMSLVFTIGCVIYFKCFSCDHE